MQKPVTELCLDLEDALSGKISLSGYEAFVLGAKLHQLGFLEPALRAFEFASELDSAYLATWHAITALRLALNLPSAALLACNEALRLAPSDEASLFNAAVTLSTLDDYAAAEHTYGRIIQQNPTHFGALLNLPPLLVLVSRPVDAIAVGLEGVRIYPASADMLFNLGEAYTTASQHEAAHEAYRQALALSPEMTKAEISLAISAAAQGLLEQAELIFTNVKSNSPKSLENFASPLVTDWIHAKPELEAGRIAIIAAYEKYRICQLGAADNLTALFLRVIDGKGCRPLEEFDMPFLAIGLSLPGEYRLRAATQVAKKIAEETQDFRLLRPKAMASQRLRIGYLCGDFRRHATSYLINRLFGIHDRNTFEVFAYSTGPNDKSDIRRAIEDGCDHFLDAQHYDDQSLAQRVVLDRIDILVDLSGYTFYARPAVFALRPAPIQISYLAYLQTSGAPWIDYVLLDQYVLTKQERAYWCESVIYLPQTLYIFDDQMGDGRVQHCRESYGVPEKSFVFCCLSAPWKISESDFLRWMAILKQVPDAILLLYAEPIEAAENLMVAAERVGVLRERLVFSGKVSHEEHLNRFTIADLFLDTHLCNAHTTSIEALSAGLPVLTWPGETVVSRVAASFLHAQGAFELIADSDEDYVAKAVRFATDVVWRNQLNSVIQRRQGSQLFCTEQRVREIEHAYLMVWQHHLKGASPEDLYIDNFVNFECS